MPESSGGTRQRRIRAGAALRGRWTATGASPAAKGVDAAPSGRAGRAAHLLLAARPFLALVVERLLNREGDGLGST